MSSNVSTQIVNDVEDGLIQIVNDAEHGLINPTVFKYFLAFNLLICAELIGCLGIVSNVINILSFAKQGLQDSVNVTLLTLSVSDIGSLIFQMLTNVFWGYPDLPFSSSASTLFIYPHGYFTRVSGYITAFAAFERCLCVFLPLKVKTIITRKVAITVNCSIYIIMLLYLFPVYYVRYLEFKYNPKSNTTVLTLFYRDNAESVYKVTYFINDLALPYISFLVLILCTAFIITSLKSKAKWRHSVTAVNTSQFTSKTGIISNKEKKISVMLTVMSVIFVTCNTPRCAMLTAVGVVRELKADGAYFDLTMLVLSFAYVLDTINCSVNTIVYYRMSSRYRETIHAWFPYLRRNHT